MNVFIILDINLINIHSCFYTISMITEEFFFLFIFNLYFLIPLHDKTIPLVIFGIKT